MAKREYKEYNAQCDLKKDTGDFLLNVPEFLRDGNFEPRRGNVHVDYC